MLSESSIEIQTGLLVYKVVFDIKLEISLLSKNTLVLFYSSHMGVKHGLLIKQIHNN